MPARKLSDALFTVLPAMNSERLEKITPREPSSSKSKRGPPSTPAEYAASAKVPKTGWRDPLSINGPSHCMTPTFGDVEGREKDGKAETTESFVATEPPVDTAEGKYCSKVTAGVFAYTEIIVIRAGLLFASSHVTDVAL